MINLKLPIDRSLLDVNFEGYKVSMDNIYFNKKDLGQSLCQRTPSSQMVTLQHMKAFSNDNQLFANGHLNHSDTAPIYRILETGHIQRLMYDKTNGSWDVSIMGSIDIGKNAENALPPCLSFASRTVTVASNGIDEVTVFLQDLGANMWSKMITQKIGGGNGLSLMEARMFGDSLHLLAYQIENGEDKKTQSRIFWTTIGKMTEPKDIKVEKVLEFVQPGHFETCTFTEDGNVVFLSSEKPKLPGSEQSVEEVAEHTWEQNGNIVQVTFKLNTAISEEDVNIGVTKNRIRLIVQETTLLSGFLGGEVDENDLEICADQKTKTLTLKLKATSDIKWEKLIAENDESLKSLENEEIKKMAKEEQTFAHDEPMEECDETEGSLFFYWFDKNTEKISKQCDVSGSQVLFVQRDCAPFPLICLRHDVDGLLWTLNDSKPYHTATLQAFGYVQASKTSRIWSGCSPNKKLACIVEGNNRILLYSQKVEVSGSLSNRKTSTTVQHVSKQHLLRIDSSDPVKGVFLTNENLFVATKDTIFVAALTF